MMGIVGAIVMHLSKTYDCIPQTLSIAKLETYGLNEKVLRLIFSYLSNRPKGSKEDPPIALQNPSLLVYHRALLLTL